MNMLNIGRAWLEIDLDAIARNYDAICAVAKTQVIPVIKADAYGHGAVAVARVLQEKSVKLFAVSNLNEALELRAAGITADILVLGYTPPVYAVSLAGNNIIQTLFSLEYAEELHEECLQNDVFVRTHLKLDTGMGRIGFDCRTEGLTGLEEVKTVLSLPQLHNEGVFTHFSVADSEQSADKAFTAGQYDAFCRAVETLERDGFVFALKHCSNSAATLQQPHMHLDAVRAGIILYGLSPSADVPTGENLTPAMTFKAAISMVKEMNAGDTVSYGRTYTVAEKRRIATVSAGYADGVPRLLSNCGAVYLKDKRAPIVGKICMDQFCIDVTDIEDVKTGDEVTLFGKELLADEVARHAQTINYEIVCGITKRVEHKYI